MKKHCLYIAILIITSLLYTERCDAQNNPYNIRDELYGYYVATNNLISEKRGLLMADTLFNRAKALGDVKAQCIALYLKVRYYHFIKDYSTEKKLFAKYTPFILKTPYLQYYFGIWNNILYEYLSEHDFMKVLSELSKYRAMAFKLQNPYAIVSSYSRQGDIYFETDHFKLAIPYYRKAIEYSKSNGSKDIVGIYFSLSRCYLYLRRWDDCDKCLQQCLKMALDETERVKVYMEYVKLYCNQDVMDRAKVKYYYDKIQKNLSYAHIIKNDMFLSNEYNYYYYLYYVGDKKKAESYIDHHFNPSTLTANIRKALYYDSIHDYKQAAYFYNEYCSEIKRKSMSDNEFLYDEFVPQLNMLRLEHERQLLKQKQDMMQLEQLTSSRKLMMLSQQRDMASLITRNKEHLLLASQLQSRNQEIIHRNKKIADEKLLAKQHRKKMQLLREKKNWQMTAMGIFMVIFGIIAMYYIRQKMKTHQKLKAEKKHAENAAKLKSMFFQNMNHEIRTPLNAIAGFNEILNGDVGATLSQDEKNSLIGMMTMNSDLLLTLVNDVLDLSNFESGSYQLKFADTDLNKLCRTAIESIRGRETDGVVLTFKPASDQPFILHTDAQRVQQILSNYLTNACKHTDSGSITLSYEVLDGLVRFSVTDTGCGINDEDADKVFKRFQMADKARQGTGLGLHICTIIASLLHGKVYLDRSYRTGARFIFDHPIVKMLLVMILSLTCSFTSLSAQNNKPGINDRVYQYYKLIKKGSDMKEENRLLDKMLSLSRQLKDSKAECFTLSEKSSLYYRALMLDSVNIYANRCRQLSLRTKNYQYLFEAWGEQISVYILLKDKKSAETELAKMFDEALRLKNDFGIFLYYYYTGNYFALQKQFAAAITFYLQTLNYHNDDKSSICGMLGQCYYYLGKYNEAIKYMNMALRYSEDRTMDSAPLEILEKSYCALRDSVAATRIFYRIKELEHVDVGVSKKSGLHAALHDYYKYIKKDNMMAHKENELATPKGNSYGMATLYYEVGEYEKSLPYFRKAAKIYTNSLNEDPLDIQKFYTSKFDMKEAVRAKDELALANTQLKIKAMRNQQKVLAIQRENTQLHLRQADAITRQKEIEINMKNLKLANQRQEMDRQNSLYAGMRTQGDIIRQSVQWRNFSVYIIMFFIFGTIVYYVIKMKLEEQKLRKEALEAEEADEKKSNFFENMNREIKAPINTIIHLNQQLNSSSPDHDYTSEERQQMMDLLNKRTQHLTILVNEVLEISKMESGTYPIKIERCDLNTICTDLLSNLKPNLKDGVETVFLPNGEVNHSPKPCYIFTDVERLSSAISRLLKTANKYTERGCIKLEYTLHDNKVSIAVADNGMGIDYSIMDKIFYMDQQKQEGEMSGLGLHRVRVIVNMLKGRIYVDENYHEGARFVIELPMKC
jgi:signal transduction histidine kinase